MASLYILAVYGAFAAVVLYILRRWIKGGQFTERVSAKGKVVVVTGSNTGIGLQTARELNIRGAKVYMLCRSEERTNEGRAAIVKRGCDPTRLIYIHCDFTKFSSVRAAAKKLSELEDHIDILVNNAGIMFYPKFELTEDGHEMTWQSNHLGPFLLTELLLPLIRKSEDGRIVNVSSMLHSNSPKLDLDHIDDKEQFGMVEPYSRTKLANVMHARELTRRLRASGVNNVCVNACHPGAVATDINRHLPFGNSAISKAIVPFLIKTDQDGAQTSVYLALSSSVKGVSGCYFADCARKKESSLASDDEACKELYEYSRRAVGIQ